jgi:F-type H+-transporting ATPase subunit epsilon
MQLHVDIITPERRVLQTEVDSVVVPAVEGELGILPNHTPLVAQLQPGHICFRAGDEIQFFAVSGGFVEVLNNRVVVMAETAEMADEIDAERARQAAERAKAILRERPRDADVAQAETALRRALARLRTAEALTRQKRYRK